MNNFPDLNPEVILIAAVARRNRVIGKQGKLPWAPIPLDMQRFQQITHGYPVIMGRKTWEFDLEKRPLPNRVNVVVSQHSPPLDLIPGILWSASLMAALVQVKQASKVFIVGGASIYAQALPIVDTLDLTFVDGDFEGDTFFPEFEPLLSSDFELVAKDIHPGFSFETYHRQTPLKGLWRQEPA